MKKIDNQRSQDYFKYLLQIFRKLDYDKKECSNIIFEYVREGAVWGSVWSMMLSSFYASVLHAFIYSFYYLILNAILGAIFGAFLGVFPAIAHIIGIFGERNLNIPDNMKVELCIVFFGIIGGLISIATIGYFDAITS